LDVDFHLPYNRIQNLQRFGDAVNRELVCGLYSHCLCRWLIVALFCLYPTLARADGVPANLASMAKDLLAQDGSLRSDSGDDPAQKAIRRRAQEILHESGVRYWATEQIREPGAAAKFAEALGLDTGDPKQWAVLSDLLSEGDIRAQHEKLKDWLRSQGKPVAGPEFDSLMQAFDTAQEQAAKDLAKHHVLEVGDRGDRVELTWMPNRNDFEIRIKAKETADGANDGFDLRLRGDVVSRPDPNGDGVALAVKAVDDGLSVLTDAEIAEISKSLFGRWREPFDSVNPGTVWDIEPAAGSATNSEDTGNTLDRQISRLQDEIERLRNDKAYRWQNPESGETIAQAKFKRLKEPWEYLGEAPADPDAERKIAERQAKIEDLQAQRGNLPSYSDDPIRMEETLARNAGTQTLTISKTYGDGFRVTYDQALISEGKITARRILRDVRDITNLPAALTRKLIASWSPPEWIELRIRVDPKTKQPYLEGLRWRLHVTYSAGLFGMGGDYDIDSIHTPYNEDLRLVQGDVAVAEGAAPDTGL